MDVLALAKLIAVMTTAPLLPGAAKPALPPLPAPASMSTGVAASSAEEDPCEAPFSYDVAGIKHYMLACLEHDRLSDSQITDCTVPYFIDTRGYHRYVEACLDSGDACAVPYSFSADGIKRFTLQCL